MLLDNKYFTQRDHRVLMLQLTYQNIILEMEVCAIVLTF